jgi:hypothetical protein
MNKIALLFAFLLVGCVNDPAPTAHNIITDDCFAGTDSTTYNDSTQVTATHFSPCAVSK